MDIAPNRSGIDAIIAAAVLAASGFLAARFGSTYSVPLHTSSRFGLLVIGALSLLALGVLLWRKNIAVANLALFCSTYILGLLRV